MKPAINVTAVKDPELFFGIVGPIGTDTKAAVEALRAALNDWNYKLEPIVVSELVKEQPIFGEYVESLPVDQHYSKAIEACNVAREKLHSNDAMVQMAVAEVQLRRLKLHGEPENAGNRVKPVPRQAYVFKSLKLPEEIQTLRSVYGSAFFVISIHAQRDARRRSLAERIKESHAAREFKDRHFSMAEALLSQDEYEGGPGQNVRSAFPEADYFTATDKPEDLKISIRRLVNMIFRHPFVTPSRSELAMSHAKTEAMRSGDLSRQIGCAITNTDGDIIAMGCNDVPRPGGGQYYEGDSDDARDYLLAYDPNDKFKRYVISEFLGRMAAEWLKDLLSKKTPEKLYEEASLGEHAFLDESRVDSLIEFGRVMHAEMAAIMDAARRGVQLKDSILYCTTFPCHMCARLIIGAGIRRVYYIEPYPKSVTPQLYENQIVVDPESHILDRVTFEPFAGVAPRRFFDLFSMTKRMRKNQQGNVQTVNRFNQPRVEILNTAYIDVESSIARRIGEAIAKLKQENAGGQA